MDQNILVNNVAKHLDSLETLVTSIVILAVAIAWAGIQRTQTIEVMGAKFDRRHAFFVVATLYLILNLSILILFLRLGDLIGFLDDKHIVKGITQLATHRWILNPFAYFGNSTIAQVYSSEGFGLLIVVWWLCNASLSSLMDDKKNWAANFLLGLFLMIGLASIWAIHRVFRIVLTSLGQSDIGLSGLVLETLDERTIGVILGIIVGVLIFFSVNMLQVRWLRAEKPTVVQQGAPADS